MPLSKLENFIKNTEGRILYVNPNDLDATDSIENQGNSLTKPFKTIQRALIESARFSYVRGSSNDIHDKTTILLFPGEHIIDNRPGFGIIDSSGAKAVSPSGTQTVAQLTLSLTLNSNFDLNQEDNILYKYNSIHGGVIIPRGTSLVGLDLRKTKIRPKYVPNPTDPSVPRSSIFKITGSCYFWQFTIFDADSNEVAYTSNTDFSTNNRSKPTFSHHKLTAFEYADGITVSSGYTATDLDMYYNKISNAFNAASGRDIEQKYPDSIGLEKVRSEWEIVGALGTDPIKVFSMISGDGTTPGNTITVTTSTAHNLTAGTPIKIKGVSPIDYNISTTVQTVTNATTFTYLLPFVRNDLPATATVTTATVTIESDTVSGASPYIFNVSLRSVFGMCGMLADGAKASGFKSMVVAQFTGVSLQKDDRAYVKYNKASRTYDGIVYNVVSGSLLSAESSSKNPDQVLHLDSDSVYRSGWETTHVKMDNDAFIQVVSVFAIGFNCHFRCENGGDASITNSNSNFGQISLVADGFKKETFPKDNQAYLTSIVTPKSVSRTEQNIDWVSVDVGLTTSIGISSHLYLRGFTDESLPPSHITLGYRVGARQNDKFYVDIVGSGTSEASIHMLDNIIGTGVTVALGSNSSEKVYSIVGEPSSNIFTTSTNANINTGEKVRVFSDKGDLSEGLEPNTVYYAIRVSATQFKVASTYTNALNNVSITVYKGQDLNIVSRVSDKVSGEVGSPIQYDQNYRNWYIHTDTNSGIYKALATSGVAGIGAATNVGYLKRMEDTRSIDDRLYKLRAFIPKESTNARNIIETFVIQESSTTGVRSDTDFTVSGITTSDYDFNRNPRFISTCTVSSNTITTISEQPHGLNTGDVVIVRNVTDLNNVVGAANSGYNGRFTISAIPNSKTFQYSTTDIDGKLHTPGTCTNNTSLRTTSLPRFEKNDAQGNYYVYRKETISEFISGTQDGIYHLYVLKSDVAVPSEFTSYEYSQNIEDLYPQLDRDNVDDNPAPTKSFAERSPLGQVVSNNLKNSVTRESLDSFMKHFNIGIAVTDINHTTAGICTISLEKEHGLNGIVAISTFAGGNGYTPTSGVSTYHNVKLLNRGTSTWDGATARVVVNNGSINGVQIVSAGSGYVNGERLDFDTTFIGSGVGAGITIVNSGISTALNTVVQVTGIGTTAGGHYRITGVSTTGNGKITIACTTGDPRIVQNQYVVFVGPSVNVSSVTYSSTTGISTFTCSGSHGLSAGNPFKIVDTNENNLGEFVVKEKVGVNTFTSITYKPVSSTSRVYRKAFAAADADSSAQAENLATRSVSFYNNEYATLIADLGSTESDIQVAITVANSGISTTSRFPLGSYIQVNGEIMRVVSSTLSGANNNEITVLRGYFGTIKTTHQIGSLINKIRPIPLEFRRTSIARASGQTFEYTGFGPGNYSTGMPQVQIRTLNEKESFYSQAQKRSGGVVNYTGMDADGNFFIGNRKLSASSSTEKTFDAPITTVTGESSSKLSAVYDEVTVKESLRVEGGSSGKILSQFDGPVTFNGDVRINSSAIIKNASVDDITLGNIRVGVTNDNTIDTTSGGLTITVTSGQSVAITTSTTITGNTTINGALFVTGDITAFYSSDERLKDNIKPIEDPLAKVLSISGNTFTWNEKSSHEGNDIGVIAQEIEKVLPEIVTTRDNGYKAIQYEKLTALLIEAVKELSAKVDDLTNKLENK